MATSPEPSIIRPPKLLLWGAAAVWIVGLPIGAWLDGIEHFWGRFAASVVTGLVGAAFAVLLGGLVIRRLESKAEQAAAERRAEAERVAEEKARREWDVRTRYIVAALIEDASSELQGIVMAVYGGISQALPQGRAIEARFLRADARVPSATPKVLRDATYQSRELMQSALAAWKMERGGVSQPPEDDDDFHGEPMDARMAAAIVKGTQAASGELADRTESLLRHVERLTSYVNEPKLELLRTTMALRSKARQFGTVDDQEPATDVQMAFERALAATQMLLSGFTLVRLLTTVHGYAVVSTRAEIDKEKATLEEELENLRDLRKQIEDLRYAVSPSQLGL